MPRQPEGKLVAKIQTYLRSEGARPFKIQGGDNFQEIGIPDILCCYHGVFYGFEVKIPPNKPSAVQMKVMREIRSSGGVAAVVTSVAEVQDLLHFDPGWVAGFYEGEGSIIARGTKHHPDRRHKPRISISQKDPSPLRYIQGYFGGTISADVRATGTYYRLSISVYEEVLRFLEAIGPRLKSPYRRNQLRAVIRQVEEATGEISELRKCLPSKSNPARRTRERGKRG